MPLPVRRKDIRRDRRGDTPSCDTTDWMVGYIDHPLEVDTREGFRTIPMRDAGKYTIYLDGRKVSGAVAADSRTGVVVRTDVCDTTEVVRGHVRIERVD